MLLIAPDKPPFRQWLLFLTWLFLSSLSSASQFTLSHTSIPTELRIPAITKVYRSSNGYYWIGTQSGLYLFRGTHLEIFSSDSKDRYWIPDSHITGIDESWNGDVFIATLSGDLLKWENQSDKVDIVDTFSPDGQAFLTDLLISNQGILWLIKGTRFLSYSPSTRSTSDWELSNLTGKEGDLPSSLAESEYGRLIIGHTNAFSVLNHDDGLLQTKKVQIPIDGKDFQLTALMPLANETLLVGTDTGHVAIIDISSGSIRALNKIGSDHHLLITDFEVHGQGVLIGTDRGLYLATNDLSSFANISHLGAGLTSSDIYSIFDNGDYQLIGTKSGLNLLTFSPFRLANETSNIVNGEVLDFAEDATGNIWIGSYSGLFRLGSKSRLHSRVGSSSNKTGSPLFDQRITAVEIVGNKIWIGFFDGGVLELDANQLYSGNQRRLLPGTGIVDILTDEIDGSTWVGSFRRGLFRIQNNSVTGFRGNGKLDENSIAFLYSLDSSDILVGCLYSIYIYERDNDRFKHLPFDFSPYRFRPIIYAAKELTSGDIWFGTKDNGLFIWRHNDRINGRFELSRIDSEKHVENLTIYGIQQDRLNNVWLSTNRGIVKLDSEGNFIRRFTMADGLQGMDFTFNSSFQSSDGRIFFGGPGGYNVFRPEEVSTHIDPPKTRLTSVRFTSNPGDRVLLTGDPATVRLTHKDKFVTFEFSIMEFVDTGNSQFRYMLENYDTEWIDNGRSHKATYTNLPTGDYRFRVQGMNAAGLWDADGDAIDLSVLPPPWLSGWAYAIYSMALLLLIWVGHRVYHSYVVERRASELAQEMFEAEERAEDDRQEQIEYQDELINSAYQHKLDTLNLVNTFVFEGSRDGTDSFFESQSSGGRKRIQILTIMEDHIYYQPDGPAADLHSFVDAITPKLLEHSPVDPETVVTINDLPESLIPTAIASPLAIIIYELLENCIQHAFDPDSQANYIFLKLEESACKGTSLSRYTLTISDDGIGAPAGILPIAEPGSGLYVVQAIVRQLEGHIELSVDQGTKVVVSLVDPE